MNLRALWKKNTIPLIVAVLAIAALVLTMLFWKKRTEGYGTAPSGYGDDDDDDDKEAKKREKKEREREKKEEKKEREREKKEKKKEKKKNKDDDDDDDDDDDAGDGCSKDEIKAAKKLAKNFAMLGRWENDFRKEPEAKCLSNTEISKAFAKGIDEARSKYEGDENWAKRVERGNQCKHGQCYGILGTQKPCRAKDDPKKCCNDPDGTKGCVYEERSKRGFEDWTCPSGYFWTGSTEKGKECVNKEGRYKGTEQRALTPGRSRSSGGSPAPAPAPAPAPGCQTTETRKYNCYRPDIDSNRYETDRGSVDVNWQCGSNQLTDAIWACNQKSDCEGKCQAAGPV